MIIVKIGGGDSINLMGIISDLSSLKEPFVIIHGANALRDSLAEKMGYSKRVITSVSGYSSVFSDSELIDLQMMAYAGLRNKRIVELCHQNGINAVGLCGLDGALIRGGRNKGIRIHENGKKRILRDLSGKPKGINKEFLGLLLNNGYIPVLTIPIIDENNTAVNSENDDILCLLHELLQARLIIQLIEAPGLMRDISDPNSFIPRLSSFELARWENRSKGRIKRKLFALRKLFENSSPVVVLGDGRREHPIADAIEGRGTIIQ